jgi:hypothetical protein
MNIGGPSQRLSAVLQTITNLKEIVVAVVVHMNDTYLLEERQDQGLPGLPRVIATVRRIRDHTAGILGADRTLVLHSGDFLAPSRASRRDKGAAMIELLNRLGLHYCVLGNHEFDYGEVALAQRLAEARFRVVLSNVQTDAVSTLPVALWPNSREPLVALAGIVSKSVHASFGSRWRFEPASAALSRFGDETPQVPFHIVLTHATRADDRAIRRAHLPSRTYFLGGHDHDIDWIEDDGHPIMKNRSNLQTMRVLLLLAGGRSALWRLDLARRDISEDVSNGPIPETFTWFSPGTSWLKALPPPEIDRLLGQLHSVDASAFRRGLTDESILGGLGQHDEVVSLLRFQDHEPSTPDDDAFVRSRILPAEAEDKLLRDFSSDDLDLDVRDEAIRSRPTPFGRLVAECVRRNGKADFALLNAGAFRCDARLSARFTVRDLLDTFLYDDARAVVVIEVPSSALRALVVHGQGCRGSGAFPQLSSDALPTTETVRLAVVSYLLENERSIDGYREVLISALGSAGELSARLARCSGRFSLVEAVIAHVGCVPYTRMERVDASDAPVEQFIRVVDETRRCFEGLSTAELSSILESQGSLPEMKLQSARDALRGCLRALPAVIEYEACDGSPTRELRRRCYDQLVAVRRELEVHPARFRNGVAYEYYFDRAAEGVGGWIN